MFGDIKEKCDFRSLEMCGFLGYIYKIDIFFIGEVWEIL